MGADDSLLVKKVDDPHGTRLELKQPLGILPLQFPGLFNVFRGAHLGRKPQQPRCLHQIGMSLCRQLSEKLLESTITIFAGPVADLKPASLDNALESHTPSLIFS